MICRRQGIVRPTGHELDRERPAEYVIDDVHDGLVTPERAKADYGISIADEEAPE